MERVSVGAEQPGAVMPGGASAALAQFALEVASRPLDARVARKVATHLLDVLGVAAAASQQEFAPGVRSVASGLAGPPEATVIGSTQRIAAPNAALANGTFAHGIDYDDT